MKVTGELLPKVHIWTVSTLEENEINGIHAVCLPQSYINGLFMRQYPHVGHDLCWPVELSSHYAQAPDYHGLPKGTR